MSAPGVRRLDESLRLLLRDLDVEDVDAGELLEQDGFALHHRFGGQRSDVAEPEHSRPVGDDAHEVASSGVAHDICGIVGDGGTREGDTWRIGKSQIVLVGDRLSGLDGNFSRRIELVIVERGAPQVAV